MTRALRARLMASVVVVPFAVGAWSGDAAAQMIGNPSEGLNFARGDCAECHYVEPEEATILFPKAPAFRDIAAEPKTTALSLKVFLRSPHIEMPNFILTEEQTDDLIAYILSLK